MGRLLSWMVAVAYWVAALCFRFADLFPSSYVGEYQEMDGGVVMGDDDFTCAYLEDEPPEDFVTYAAEFGVKLPLQRPWFRVLRKWPVSGDEDSVDCLPVLCPCEPADGHWDPMEERFTDLLLGYCGLTIGDTYYPFWVGQCGLCDTIYWAKVDQVVQVA